MLILKRVKKNLGRKKKLIILYINHLITEKNQSKITILR